MQRLSLLPSASTWLSLSLIALLFAIGSAQQNVLYIREAKGVTVLDYPLQFGRPFGVGEIPNYPTVQLNGSTVPTQVDIKKRWADNSIRHAILSLIIPRLDANSTLELRIIDSATPTVVGGGFNASDLLSWNPSFDAIMTLTSRDPLSTGQTQQVSIRSLISTVNASYWISGPITTTIILTDHSGVSDLGWSGLKPFRPIFHVQVWPTLNLTSVRFIGEISNSEQLKDLNYDIELSLNSEVVFTDTDVPHRVAQRWTRRFWTPYTPPKEIDIDYNTKYLISIGALPNYNTSVPSYPQSAIVQGYSGFFNSPFLNKLLYAVGLSACTGCFGPPPSDMGRPFSLLTLNWVFAENGDWRAREWILQQYERFSAQLVHLREGSSRMFDGTAGNTTQGLGRILTHWGRPGVWPLDGRNTGPDRLIVNPSSLNMSLYDDRQTDWRTTYVHNVDVGSLQYLLTGDFFFLEQVQFQASASTLRTPPGTANYQRGPTNCLYASGASDFWNKMTAAWVSPDSTPEHRYFMNITLEHIGFIEGAKSITGTPLDGTPTKSYAIRAFPPATPNPLWTYSYLGTAADRTNEGYQPAITGRVERRSSVYSQLSALHVALERGFGELTPLRALWTKNFISRQFQEIDTFNRMLSIMDVLPLVHKNGTLVKTFTESSYLYEDPIRTSPSYYEYAGWGQPMSVSYAVASVVDQDLPFSLNVWNWFYRHHFSTKSAQAFALDRRLNILPRVIPSYPSFCGASPTPEAECIGNNTWIVLPRDGIRSSATLVLPSVTVSAGSTFTIGNAQTTLVSGNLTVDCNSTLVSQVSQVAVTGTTDLCGRIELQYVDPSRSTITTGDCINLDNAGILVNASSLSSTSTVTLTLAEFGCKRTDSYGSVQLVSGEADCRKFALGTPSYSEKSLTVVVEITPCSNSELVAFPIYPVVGGVVGGIVLIGIIAVIIFVVRKRNFVRLERRRISSNIRSSMQ